MPRTHRTPTVKKNAYVLMEPVWNIVMMKPATRAMYPVALTIPSMMPLVDHLPSETG